MNIWGLVTAAVGLLLFCWATTQSEFVVYRLLVARNKSVWGENVHRFHQFSGLAVITFGVLLALRIVGR
ncbi:MAG: hypothetical protein NXI04_21060 [Planctomycetaceae bacterium]|nr:hypothetical protein [Planctomycetaceae bacterium]